MKVKDIMSAKVSFVDPTVKVADIAMLMSKQDIGSVPVVRNNSVIGIVTDRDIVIRAVAEKKDILQATAENIMTDDPITIEENSDIDQAADLMAEYQIKRLPVTSNGKLVGILALGDLAIEHIHMDEAGEALSGISKGITH